jgi:type VI secretion system secreted protein VgrG
MANHELLKWNSPALPGKYHLVKMEGPEGFSQLFEYDLKLILDHPAQISDPAAAEIRSALSGKSVSFTLDQRTIVGMGAQPVVNAVDGSVRLKVVPHLAKLQYASGYRVYHNKTVPEIVQAVCDALEIPVAEKREIIEPEKLTRFSYKLQYQETHFQFLSRLLEDQGLTYLFPPHFIRWYEFEPFRKEPREELVLTDHPHKLFPGILQVDWRPEHAQHESGVHSWEWVENLVPGQVALNAWNWRTPQELLWNAQQVKASPFGKQVEIYDMEHFANSTQGLQALKIRAEQEAVERSCIRGRSAYRELHPGCRFQFRTEGPVPGTETFVITRIYHRATDEPEWREPRYQNEFEAISEDVVYRPSRATPRQLIPGYVPALVTNEKGEEKPEGQRMIVADRFGRVLVRFPWQRGDDRAIPIPARVSQFWAGKGYGAWFLPRVGQEVLVAFEEGDPDRPTIIGSVYHDPQDLPFDLSRHPWSSGIVTALPSGNGLSRGSVLRFDDSPGNARLSIQVPGSFFTQVDDIHHVKAKTEVSEGDTVIGKAKKISLEAEGSYVDVEPSSVHVNSPKTKLNCSGGKPAAAPPFPAPE